MHHKNQHIITLPLSTEKKNQQRENMQNQYFVSSSLKSLVPV